LGLVIFTALAFDFTNGFHDTANAMATSIATGALRPKVAVALSAVLNLIGAFLSVEVALTVTNAVIKIQDKSGAPKAEMLADGGMGLLLILLWPARSSGTSPPGCSDCRRRRPTP
jgi:PiT family inorganic phosphate transporter